MTREEAISRTAALNTLDTMDKALDEYRTVEEYKELLRECFEQLPSVSIFEKTGRRILQECNAVIDKIRAEIDRQEKWLVRAGYNAYNVDIAFDAIKAVSAESEDKEMKGFTYNQIILCRGEIRQACAELLEDMQDQKNKPDAGTICTVVILAELLEHKLFGGGIIQ